MELPVTLLVKLILVLWLAAVCQSYDDGRNWERRGLQPAPAGVGKVWREDQQDNRQHVKQRQRRRRKKHAAYPGLAQPAGGVTRVNATRLRFEAGQARQRAERHQAGQGHDPQVGSARPPPDWAGGRRPDADRPPAWGQQQGGQGQQGGQVVQQQQVGQPSTTAARRAADSDLAAQQAAVRQAQQRIREQLAAAQARTEPAQTPRDVGEQPQQPQHAEQKTNTGGRADQARPLSDGRAFEVDQSLVKHSTGTAGVQRPVREDQRAHEPAIPTAIPKPKMAYKKDIEWYEEFKTFALRSPPDNRLMIRHAPIPALGTPWPMPQSYHPSATLRRVYPHQLSLVTSDDSCNLVNLAFTRMRKLIIGEADVTDPVTPVGLVVRGELKTVRVNIRKPCTTYPYLEMDESYAIDMHGEDVIIRAAEVWGALRGLETFSQLVFEPQANLFVVNHTFINDFPRFKHRGLLLDTSRHFITKKVIFQNLEAMAQNKMNVFHWHIVDDQSFPFESKVFPNLTKMGAYDPVTHVYTQSDVQEVIEYARRRGIRVIPEFDTPGHTMSWGYGVDYLLTPCFDYTKQPNGFHGPINPILKATYRFLQKLFAEIMTVFPEKYLHLGGDEVPFDCWTSNPHIMNFIRRNNLSDIRDVLALYERKLLDIIAELGRLRKVGSGTIVWQEVFDNGVKLNSDAIVQIWMGDASDVERVTSAGYRALFSTCWYLDYISYGQDWDKYYRCEQLSSLESYRLVNESLLLGGDVCMWAEYADSRGLPVGVLSGPGYCSRYARQGARRAEVQEEVDLKPAGGAPEHSQYKAADNPHIYVVDMNAMYLVPLLVVVCLCCLTLLSHMTQDPARAGGVKARLVALLLYPMPSTRRGVKSLLFVFFLFATVWCVWTAPIWLHAWENVHSVRAQRRTSDMVRARGIT